MTFVNKLKQFSFYLSLITLMAIIYDFGFNQKQKHEYFLGVLYTLTLSVGILSILSRYLKKSHWKRSTVLAYDVLSLLFLCMLWIDEFDIFPQSYFFNFFSHKLWYYLGLILVFVREASSRQFNLSRAFFNPAQLFILSFLLIIVFGALLLMLPNATTQEISFLNALFTSTSAVCVTGLIVVPTGTYFTLMGQFIILLLIQIGGLGIMTVASYFSYFFRGGTSYENQLVLSDMTNSNKLGEVFSTLKNIILVTITIEAIGATLIFGTLDGALFKSYFDKSFFAIFHAVSAFCNAGFSTLSESLFAIDYRFNYGLQSIILFLFIIGGLGFPIVFNLFNYVSYLFKNRIFPFLLGQPKNNVVTPWVVNLNSRIVLITSALLFAIGTSIFLIFEYDNSLAEHNTFGKIITSLFAAATPRTAGFNTVDTSALNFSTIMLLFLLMWIGGSPASTAGGIKTSTFAIATLNFWSLARGKERLEVFRREIANISIRRAFAIISLSLIVIGMAVFLISYFDSDKSLIQIAFECFSAYSTVGLSLGITSTLSEASKLVIIGVMFVGRVSMLSILIAIVSKVKHKHYRYSKEEILIN